MRIYCPPENISKNKITLLDKEQIHHLVDVARLRAGERMYVFDGRTQEYECVIDKIVQDKVVLTIHKVKKIPEEKISRITLACAIPKKSKIDFIIEKTTELGVERIIPLQTERTIVKISENSMDSKLRRWQAVAREAAKQCGRIKLPQVEPVAGFNSAISMSKDYDLAIIPNLCARNRHIKDVVSNFRGKPASGGRSVIVFIGPEGDFSQDEARRAEDNGCIGVSLGEFTLKVDTAAIAVVSFLRFYFQRSNENF
jgi:16S rRNA (uracil1498-N3)-methyltransferase